MSTTSLTQTVHSRQRSIELRPPHYRQDFKPSSPRIHDIRSKGEEQIKPRQAIVTGISSDPPRIPEFLLWDDTGLDLFDKFSQTATYYPFHSEIEIFNHHASSIVQNIPSGSVVLELGCGTIRKTQTILSALLQAEKSISYYALDLSLQTLQESITALANSLPSESNHSLSITGLHGTYEDSITFLPTLSSTTKAITFLWLGNSIANFATPHAASCFLTRLKDTCLNSGLTPQFLISTDICNDIQRMNVCYDLQKPELMRWLRHGFVAANQVLGREVFVRDGGEWEVITEFEDETRNLETYYVARRDVVMTGLEGEKLRLFEKGSRIGVITSGKWSEVMMRAVCENAGLLRRQCWSDEESLYAVSLLVVK